MCTHLAKRGSRYYFRRRIPLALIPHFQRTEIVKALGTSNRSEAERLARLEGCRWDNEFARLQGETVNSLPDYEIMPTGPKLADLHQQWLSNGEKAPKTRDLYVRALGRFAEIVGNDHVKSISRTDCRTFRDALKEQGLSVKTVNNYLAALSSLFTLAVDDEVVERNPTEGLSLKDTQHSKEKRLPFDEASLKKVFTSPVFNGDRPKAGAGEASYWLPLLALYTGARLEEIGQLHPSDVHQETFQGGSAWVIEINDRQEGQHLKNASSRRRIPVHPELIKLGFIDFANKQKGDRIFHQLKADVFGTLTGNWSKWFGRYLRNVCGVTDKRMVFHSFRHTFKDMCRLAGIDEAVHDALTGHSSSSVSRNYGGLNYPLGPLVDAVEKLSFQPVV
ncbi:site-specific integrase [Serratia fonticola]|uniref:site-specific integrase n=1 Tax=Serratia fonticola TaxID=47917 RepID=UPI00192CEC76|nr:site-specific integrase [Serratia fonticola]MBL5825312.1 phage integrase N-terminal SAM-like domain-containing protein [Serratia fonticola]